MALIDYRGNIDAKGNEHKGVYIASGPKGLKVMFKHGANPVDDDEWIALREAPGVKRRLEDGTLRVLEEPTKDRKGKGGAFDFTALPKREAMEMIAATIDEGALGQWLDAESKRKPKRKDVLAALKERYTHVTTDVNGDPTEQIKPEFPAPRGLSPGEHEVTPKG